MYAVIETGGKQYKVEPGQTVRVEHLPTEVGATFEFSNVLLVGNGDKIEIGTPCLPEAKVHAKVVAHGRHKKISIIKQKRRKHHMKRMGHRQDFTELKIDQIVVGA